MTFNWGKIGKSDVVIFKDLGRFYLKRVESVNGRHVYLESDNKRASSKVWQVFWENIIGRVIFKY